MYIQKMHCCGNDFCMLEYSGPKDYSELAIKLCNRKTGIGADGMIVLKENPLECICFSPNGTREIMNGNALRCFAKFAYERGHARRNKLEVVMGQDMYEIEVITPEPFTSRLNLGKPIYNNSVLAVTDILDCFGRVITLGNRYITIYSLFLGTINTVIFVDDFDTPACSLAKEISTHPIFFKGTNVNYVKIVNKDKIIVKTYENGIGFTDCCSTGCAASVVAAQKLGYTKTKVKVELPLGEVEVEINKKGIVLITGPAKEVFSCDIKEDM